MELLALSALLMVLAAIAAAVLAEPRKATVPVRVPAARRHDGASPLPPRRCAHR